MENGEFPRVFRELRFIEAGPPRTRICVMKLANRDGIASHDRDRYPPTFGSNDESKRLPAHLMEENMFVQPTGNLPIVGMCVATDNRDATFLAAVNHGI